MNRRQFLQTAGHLSLASGLSAFSPDTGREPPSQLFRVHVPPFLAGVISENAITYLNTRIPYLLGEYRDWFPLLDTPPQFIVVNTMPQILQQYGNEFVGIDFTGTEVLTLSEIQYLLVTLRFGSAATPHRGTDLKNFGKVVYLKQHPQWGYHPPDYFLLEEMIHIQQDKSIMRTIIGRESLDPVSCLHRQLKGISELGAHYLVDSLLQEFDYVFVTDDQIHCESAEHAMHILADRLNTTAPDLADALIQNASLYESFDEIAMTQYQKHIWEMITTWRYARDANGDPTNIAPAFLPF